MPGGGSVLGPRRLNQAARRHEGNSGKTHRSAENESSHRLGHSKPKGGCVAAGVHAYTNLVVTADCAAACVGVPAHPASECVDRHGAIEAKRKAR